MRKSAISLLLTAALFAASACNANIGDELRAGTAASTENITVNGAMMSYYYNDVYNTFVDYYGSYVEYFGLDTEKSLRDQRSEDNQSWYDYFMGGAKLVVEDILILNEAAAASGVSLSDAEKAAIKSRSDRMDTGLYGDGITKEDINDAKLLEALAYKYQFMKKAEFVPDADVLRAVRDENANKYRYVDYCSFEIYYAKDGQSSKGTFTESRAAELANELARSSDKAEFEKTAEKILLAEDSKMSEKDIEAKLSKLETKGALFEENSKVSEWAFGEDSKDTLVLSDPSKTMYTVYLRTSEPYYNEAKTVNVRHVLLSEENWGSCDETRAKAEELFEKFTKNGGNAETLGLLALEYSADESTYYNGGLYENLTEGRTVEAFNDWCFDPARKAGDAEIIESEYGWHLMFFEGEGLPVWQTEAAEGITSEALSQYLAEITEAYKVTFYDDVIYSIPD